MAQCENYCAKRKMSESHRTVQCRCTNAIYSGSYAESDSDLDDAPDARGSTAEMQDARKSLTASTKIESSMIFRDPSEKSIAVEVLKKTDADRMSRISKQNLKLSLLFPEASLHSLIMLNAIPPPFLFVK